MHFAKLRYNQAFHLVGADMFLKSLLNSKEVRANCPLIAQLDEVQDVQFKTLQCTVTNLAYFDFLEELNIVGGDGTIMGDFEEWVEGI